MRLVKRISRPRFPSDMPQWLELFGRYLLDEVNSGIDSAVIWERLPALFTYATSDREGFFAELESILAEDQSGFATSGAARLVSEIFSEDALEIPAALSLIDAGIRFKLARGLPFSMLTGYEIGRVFDIHPKSEGSTYSQHGVDRTTVLSRKQATRGYGDDNGRAHISAAR